MDHSPMGYLFLQLPRFHGGVGLAVFFHGQATTSGCNGSTIQVSWRKKHGGAGLKGFLLLKKNKARKRVMKTLGGKICLTVFFGLIC